MIKNFLNSKKINLLTVLTVVPLLSLFFLLLISIESIEEIRAENGALCGSDINKCVLSKLRDEPDTSTEYLWKCYKGAWDEPTDINSCSYPKPAAGVCGSAARDYSSDEFFPGIYSLCETGSPFPANPPDPSIDGSTSWICKGSNGAPDSPTCVATRYLATINIGLKVNQGTQSNPDIQTIGILKSDYSPLRIAKNGIIYNIGLVNPSHPAATKVLIKLASGEIKALRKFLPGSPLFLDQEEMAQGYCNHSVTSFYATFDIGNNTAVDALFTRIGSTGSGGSPNKFTVPAKSTISRDGFGFISYSDPMCNIEVPGNDVGSGGSATYSVTQNGIVIGEVTYSWVYNK